MKIMSPELINFKCFSKLRIKNIPTDVRLVLLKFIEPVNDLLAAIFGESPQTAICIAGFEDAMPNKSAKLIFKKMI